MSLRKNIIRVNDHVKIINPEIVLRWGYPLTKQIVKDTLITQEQKDSIYSMFKSFGVGLPPNNTEDNALRTSFLNCLEMPLHDNAPDAERLIYDEGHGDIYEKVLDNMAYMILKQKQYGGKERKLFTLNRESLRNKLGQVVGRKVIKTGSYCTDHSYHSSYYGDDYDYDPPYLANEQTHVLYKVYLDYEQEGICPNINEDGGIWIEKVNLGKMLPTYV